MERRDAGMAAVEPTVERRGMKGIATLVGTRASDEAWPVKTT